MTDGQSYYPRTGIKNFKTLINKHEKSFMYASILLG